MDQFNEKYLNIARDLIKKYEEKELKIPSELKELINRKIVGGEKKPDSSNCQVAQETPCIDLINQAISTLETALTTCSNDSISCSCEGEVVSSFSSITVNFLETDFEGSGAILANICDNCTPENSSFIFSFITSENAVPFVVGSNTIKNVQCVPTSIPTNSGIVMLSGIGTFQIGNLTISNVEYALVFGNCTQEQCFFSLSVNEPENPSFFLVSSEVPCEDVTITSCV